MNHSFDFTTEKDVELLTEETRYKGFFTVKEYYLRHRLFSGSWSQPFKRELFERPPVVAALPYDPHQDNVILIQQFRTGALKDPSPWLFEIVAGVTDPGDINTEQVIRRELKEETGLIADHLQKIYEYWVSPGGSNEYLTLYCAKVSTPDKEGVQGMQEEDEDIFLHIVKVDEALEMLSCGKIKNAVAIIALQWLALNRKKLKNLWI